MRFLAWQAGRQPASAQARQQLPLFLRRLAKLGAVIALLLLVGTVGFALTEDTSL